MVRHAAEAERGCGQDRDVKISVGLHAAAFLTPGDGAKVNGDY